MDVSKMVEEWYERHGSDLVECPLFIKPVRRCVARAIKARPRSLRLDQLFAKSHSGTGGWDYLIGVNRMDTFLVRPKECLSSCKICSKKSSKAPRSNRQYSDARCQSFDAPKIARKSPQRLTIASKSTSRRRSAKSRDTFNRDSSVGVDSDCIHVRTVPNCSHMSTISKNDSHDDSEVRGVA